MKIDLLANRSRLSEQDLLHTNKGILELCRPLQVSLNGNEIFEEDD